jgi:hypothetical protein
MKSRIFAISVGLLLVGIAVRGSVVHADNSDPLFKPLPKDEAKRAEVIQTQAGIVAAEGFAAAKFGVAGRIIQRARHHRVLEGKSPIPFGRSLQFITYGASALGLADATGRAIALLSDKDPGVKPLVVPVIKRLADTGEQSILASEAVTDLEDSDRITPEEVAGQVSLPAPIAGAGR